MDFLLKIPCIVIHRQIDVEREPTIRELERKLGRELQVLEGVRGDTLIEQGFPRKHPIERKPTSAGNIGCTASHLQILQNILSGDHKAVCIFEDDAEYVSDFSSYVSQIPDDWDICFLGVNEIVEGEPVSDTVVQVRRFWGTHAVILREKAMRSIQEMYFQSLKDDYALPADWLYSYAIQRFHLKAYAPKKAHIRQKPGFVSTISGNIRR